MTAITRRRALQAGASAALGLHPLLRAGAAVATRTVFVGSFTNASGESIPRDFGTRPADHISHGIYSFDFDTATGRAGTPRLAATAGSPLNLILRGDGRRLYACRGQDQNLITAYAVDGAALRELNTVPCGGSGPTVGVVDRSSANLLTTNFASHDIVCFRLRADGSLGELSARIGGDPGAERTKPHAIVLSRTQRFAIAGEIGANRCRVLRFDAATGALTTHGLAADVAGAGPRHLVFDAGFRHLYTSGESGSSISAWRWDEDAGSLEHLQTLGVLPEGFTGRNQPADIALHPAGRFVYVTNRGTGRIAAFAIDAGTGLLTPAAQTPAGAADCWSLIFAPQGNWAIAALQSGDAIAIFAVDERTGALHATGQSVPITLPTCVRMA